MDRLFFFCFVLLLDDVFGADVVVMSVMKRDDVTLPVAWRLKGDERLLWKFNDKDIAAIHLDMIPSQTNYPDERFTNRLFMDPKSGSLTINNIRTEDTGEYQLKIKGIIDKNYYPLKTFSVTVTGVSGADDVTVMSVMKGDSVTLPINASEIKGDEWLLWKFKNAYIALIDLGTSQPNYIDERFTNRLNLDPQTGSLTVNNITTKDAGEYQVKIKDRQETNYKPLKTFNVTVTGE
nr:uncharacterized protein LOC129453528 [Misgurnus anguillicaudatus]